MKVVIDYEVLNEVNRYLVTKPYNEVADLLKLLSTGAKYEEYKEQETQQKEQEKARIKAEIEEEMTKPQA